MGRHKRSPAAAKALGALGRLALGDRRLELILEALRLPARERNAARRMERQKQYPAALVASAPGALGRRAAVDRRPSHTPSASPSRKPTRRGLWGDIYGSGRFSGYWSGLGGDGSDPRQDI